MSEYFSFYNNYCFGRETYTFVGAFAVVSTLRVSVDSLIGPNMSKTPVPDVPAVPDVPDVPDVPVGKVGFGIVNAGNCSCIT